MTTAPGAAARPEKLPLILAVVAVVAVVIPAGLLGGAFAAPVAGLPDIGPVVRWGIPIVRAIHDLAAASTVGLLVMAATIIPEARTTSRRITAARYACASGVVWVVAGLVGLVFSFADLSGTPLSDPTFGGQLQSFLFQLEFLRVAAISTGLVLVVTIGAALVRRQSGMAALAALSILAILPLALAGHASGAASHDLAVNSLGLHLVSAVLWVGGLLALAMLRPLLGTGLAVSVQRYSTLAGSCFVAVAVSGVANAWIRIGSIGNLATGYGVLVILKVVALVALGIAGWQQRARVVDRIATDPLAGRLFGRLALIEVVIMSAAFALGAALSRSALPGMGMPMANPDPAYALTGYPTPVGPLLSSAWFTIWRIDWLWLTVAIIAVALYLVGVQRMRERGDSWPVLRTLGWVLGWAIFVWATSGAPGVYGRLLFSAHMVMHMTIAIAAPIPMVLAAPITLTLRTLTPRQDNTLGPRELLLALVHFRFFRVIANPIVASVIFLGSLIVFYYSPLFELALRTHTGHVLMTTHFLLAGYLFAWVLVGTDPGPKRWSPPLLLVILFGTISFHAFFGVALRSGTTLLAPTFFQSLHLPWAVDLLADQRTGGAVAWGIGELPTLVLALLVTLAWVRSDSAESTLVR
ncbi:MAG: bifunctional copper resistance protein CopD/cytochrome c oxidase assembly protein [Phycicoccus sp.]|nr:bifunctional copper resistance protein CopD/cytochrome c oxidase assembly protein [Phycicoccus sp.]